MPYLIPRLVLLVLVAVLATPRPASTQAPAAGEVRQIVSFTLQTGASAEVRAIYRDELLELYRADPAMRSLRVFREAESPVPVDLVVVRAFDGMAGMDASNEALDELAAGAGASVGAIYGRIAGLSTGHTDEFVRMIPELGHGDPVASPLTGFMRYRIAPGMLPRFRRVLEETILPLEERHGWTSATAIYLLGDGWDVLRIVGFESLGGFESWNRRVLPASIEEAMDQIVDVRTVQLLVSIPEFAIR